MSMQWVASSIQKYLLALKSSMVNELNPTTAQLERDNLDSAKVVLQSFWVEVKQLGDIKIANSIYSESLEQVLLGYSIFFDKRISLPSSLSSHKNKIMPFKLYQIFSNKSLTMKDFVFLAKAILTSQLCCCNPATHSVHILYHMYTLFHIQSSLSKRRCKRLGQW